MFCLFLQNGGTLLRVLIRQSQSTAGSTWFVAIIFVCHCLETV